MSADPPKREILNPDDTLQSSSGDPDAQAEARAKAARRVLEEEAERKRQEQQQNLGWHGRLWTRLSAFARRYIGAPFAFIAIRVPIVARIAGAVWPVIKGVSTRTDEDGQERLSLAGKILIAAAVLLIAWPLFKIYYVLGTKREFRDVQITFKQIITHDRYLVFGDHTGIDGKENMAFNVTDSWVYWNWTPDLTFAQIPLVGRCTFHTYGWYVRVPRFVPFLGRTLLVEPVIIDASCTDASLPPNPGQ